MALVLIAFAPAVGEANECRVLEAHMTPAADLQMVVWIEDTAGNYVDTIYITQLTGTYGLGNRPGIMEFNTAYRWPYGRRISTFPVWAHRHGLSFPLVIFQDQDPGGQLIYDPNTPVQPEENLSHSLSISSRDTFYCRPLKEGEDAWDAQSCATAPAVFTDKGFFHATQTSRYPPRSDLVASPGIDHDDVLMFAELNPFDAVSRPTPVAGAPAVIEWAYPANLVNGDYVLWVEASRELDQNEFYNFGSPQGIPWSEYGIPYRGQPSVLYQVPFNIGNGPEFVGRTVDYVGYGDPDGIDGNVRDPDVTIADTIAGSGARRLTLIDDGSDMYRVKVVARSEDDQTPPARAANFELVEVTTTTATVSFTAPGDDDFDGLARGYDVRLSAGTPIDESNIADMMVASVSLDPAEAGTEMSFTLEGLLPRTNYYLAVRAYDECLNYGPVETLLITTPIPEGGKVDACFVATAAYGTAMAADVVALRKFRDVALRNTVVGELFVEAYYTFGPAMARTIAPSDALRAFTRRALEPLVSLAVSIVR